MDDNKNNPSFNSSKPVNRRKNADAGEFKTSLDSSRNEVFSNSSGQRKSFSTGQSLDLIEKRKNQFSVKLPSDAERRTAQPQSRQTAQRPAPQQQTARPAAQPQASGRSAQRAPAQNAAAAQNRRTAQTAARPAQARPAAAAPAKEKRSRKASAKPRISAEEKRLRREERRRARLRSLLATIVCAVFIGIITISLSVIAISTINDILCIGKEGGATISVVVEEGDGFDAVFDRLCENGLVSQKQLCKIFCKYRKYDTVKYEPGVYYFDTSDGVEAMLEEMMVSKSGSHSVIRLTFPEGWTVAKIFQKIEKYEVCTAEKLYANLDIVGQQYGFYKKITSKSGRYLMTEGYLFPDTYEFFIGESASSVLKKLFANFEEHWKSEYTAKAKEQGMTMDQILTIASILQREAADKTQMKDIASVIYNRLRSAQYKMLECDSTTDYIYSLNKNFKLFSDADYSMYYEAYNTYSIEGLTPGPICNPGKDAIEAALEPNQTDYYYFAHDKNGQIYLSTNQYEHQQNVAKIFSESE